MEILIEILAEGLIQFLLELIADLFSGSRWSDHSKAWYCVAYLVLGAAIGGLSLLLVPTFLPVSVPLKVASIVVIPVLAGLMMRGLGNWRKHRGKGKTNLETFTHAYCFAFGMALVRSFG